MENTRTEGPDEQRQDEPTGLPSQDGRLSLTKADASTRLALLWDDMPRFILAALLGLFVVPFSGFVVVASIEGSLYLPGEGRGLLDTPSMLTVSGVVFLVVVLMRYALETTYETFESFNERTLRFKGDQSSAYLRGNYDEFASTLTRKDIAELLQFYESLLSRVTFRDGPECPDNYESISRVFTLLYRLCLAGGGLLLLALALYHWFAEATYGVDIWSSSAHPLSFGLRTIYEAILLLIVMPWVLVAFCILCFLIYHPFRVLHSNSGLRFHRVSLDGVNGFGAFGNQAFKNMLILSPFAVQLAVYAYFLPTTPILIGGVALFILVFPSFFFLQLVSAHKALDHARRVELEILGNAYAAHYEAYKAEIINDESSEQNQLDDRHESIERADAVYSQVRNSPTWPFERSVLTKLVSTLFSLISGFIAVLGEGLLF